MQEYVWSTSVQITETATSFSRSIRVLHNKWLIALYVFMEAVTFWIICTIPLPCFFFFYSSFSAFSFSLVSFWLLIYSFCLLIDCCEFLFEPVYWLILWFLVSSSNEMTAHSPVITNALLCALVKLFYPCSYKAGAPKWGIC